MKRYDLAVAYRIYPGVSKRPPIHADDKLALFRLCLASFKRSLGSLSVKVIALLDGCPPEYQESLRAHFAPEDLEIVPLDGAGNAETFFRQMSVLRSQEFSDSIFFLEDDYFFLPDQIPQMLEFQRSHPDAHFISPYDHLDYHTYRLHRGPRETRRHGGKEWRSAISTTCTFLTSKAALDQAWGAFRKYPRLGDLGIFLGVTSSAPDVVRLIRDLRRTEERWLVPILKRTLRLCLAELLFRRKLRLWYPVPSMATHMDLSFLAPAIDWRLHFETLSMELRGTR